MHAAKTLHDLGLAINVGIEEPCSHVTMMNDPGEPLTTLTFAPGAEVRT